MCVQLSGKKKRGGGGGEVEGEGETPLKQTKQALFKQMDWKRKETQSFGLAGAVDLIPLRVWKKSNAGLPNQLMA